MALTRTGYIPGQLNGDIIQSFAIMKQTSKNKRIKKLSMTRGIFTVLFIVFLSQLKGQDSALFYVNGQIKISEGNTLFIPGALHTGENVYFDNGGEVYVTGSLVNQSLEPFKPSSYGKMDNEWLNGKEKSVISN
jgi:hypothetical protein